MLPNREGLFHAHPASIGVDETGQNNLATCIIGFSLYEELADGAWENCEDEHLEITGYFYIEKKDRSINTLTVDALKAAFGWDGRDPFWLQDTDLSQHPVQVKLGFEEYNGKQRIKVQFLNPHGSAPSGVRKGDENVRKSVNARLGAKLRATAGSVPSPSPKSPAPPRAPGKPAPTATEAEAWGVFLKACKPDWTKEHIESEWFRILKQMFPGKEVDALTPADWAVMIADGPSKIVPF
jgi:hypothetical protein